MKKFALIGAAGYIAPRHMKAIKETNNTLVAAFDVYDGIGIMDSYFPKADFFTEYERFDAFLDKYKRDNDKKIDYIGITTPNYLHESHIKLALKNGSDAICEKPLVLNVESLEELKLTEKQTAHKVNTILQLRLHHSIVALKKKVASELQKNPKKVYDIDLTYLTSRGKWYFESWKGNEAKSGGIASNIGIHFFDMLCWIFGELKESIVHLKTLDTNSGLLVLKNANVRWFLSLNSEYLPDEVRARKQSTFRSIKIDNEEIEFSGGFKDLHTLSYKEILKGNGFGLDDAYSSIKIASDIRVASPTGLSGEYHPFCKKIL